MRKVFALLMALCLLLAACGPGAPTPSMEDVVILYTNDIHTYLDGPLSYDVLAGLKTELERQYGAGNVLLVDAGDHIQGTAYGSTDKGRTIIELMNGAGYDAATLGNHEFDYGMDRTMELVQLAEYPYLSCNFYEEKAGVRGENILPASTVIETAGGMRVAFVGITNPESFTSSTPAYFQDEMGNYIYGISGGPDGSALWADIQKAVDGVEADAVIGLGHLGNDPASVPYTSEMAIAHVSGLDAFIDGHSHTTMAGKLVSDLRGEPVVLTQTGDYFGAVGILIIDGQTGAVATDLIRVRELTEPDGGYVLDCPLYTGDPWPVEEDIADLKKAWIDTIHAQLGVKIGTASVVLDNYDADGKRLVRRQETNSGDFCADALYYLFDSMGLPVDAAIMNGGGIRNKALTGELTCQSAKEIHTFGNVACLQTVTGQQLLDALEWGARGAGTGEKMGSFLQVSGITFQVDTRWPASMQVDEKGVWIGGPTGGYRVHDVMVYNRDTQSYEPLELNRIYHLAGYNYTLRNLGDGFNMFSGAVNVVDYVMEDYQVLAAYIQGFPNSDVGAANSPLLTKYPNMLLDYGTVDGSGRIVLNTAPAQ